MTSPSSAVIGGNSTKSVGKAPRFLRGLSLAILAVSLGALVGCGGTGPKSQNPSANASEGGDNANARGPQQPDTKGRHFEEPGELDKMLEAKPIALAAVKPASQSVQAAAAAPTKAASGTRGSFRIQIGAESDVDAAQAKKAEYERLIGGTVDMVFDAPYYKLRWGYFDTKQEAEDKILELTDQKIQGFVIKQ